MVEEPLGVIFKSAATEQPISHVEEGNEVGDAGSPETSTETDSRTAILKQTTGTLLSPPKHATGSGVLRNEAIQRSPDRSEKHRLQENATLFLEKLLGSTSPSQFTSPTALLLQLAAKLRSTGNDDLNGSGSDTVAEPSKIGGTSKANGVRGQKRAHETTPSATCMTRGQRRKKQVMVTRSQHGTK